MALTDLSKNAGAVEQLINDLAEAFLKKRWVKILSFGVVLVLILNPPTVQYGLKFLDFNKPLWYSYPIWGLTTISLLITAFTFALRTNKEKQEIEAAPPTSIIKGILPYTSSKEDAQWFAKLQRGRTLHDCMRFCLGIESSFAIFSGESGAGKTSVLQAGLLPNIDTQKYRLVYVKLTDRTPLYSICQSLNISCEEVSPDADNTLLEVLRQVTQDDPVSIILILDQFEQFFIHHKSKVQRKFFIQQMAEWYVQSSSLPVKILISIRGDFADRLTEFQSKMKYTLTPHNYIPLEKFQPQEAASVISVIAKEAKIECDEGFIKALTKDELADREDGTVSPIDVQILSWMIDDQKDAEKRAFNRKTFQRLGGVEGLLKSFLDRALEALKPNVRLQQSVIKVMLALTNGNLRAGPLSLKDLKEKLNGVVPSGEIDEAISWLTRSEVRLVTSLQEKNVTLYELAHERIIPPLRRLASKEISDVELAQQTLDRRVNEWIGNNRSRRYLLTFKEWWLIKRNLRLIASSSINEHKEEFIYRSKKRFVVFGVSFVTIVLLAVSGLVGFNLWERRPKTQIYYTQKRLNKLLDENKDAKATKYASLLLPLLEGNGDQELSQRLWKKINQLDPVHRAAILVSLAEANARLGKTSEATRILNVVEEIAETLTPPDQFLVFLSLVEAYARLGMDEKTSSALDKAQLVIQKLDVYEVPDAGPLFGEAYSKLLKAENAVELLEMLQPRAEKMGESSQAIQLRALAEAYGRLTDIDRALKGLDKTRQAAEKLESTYQAQVLASLAESYSTLPNTAGARKGLDRIYKASEKLDPYKYNDVAASVIIAHVRLDYTDEAAKGWDKALQSVESLDPNYQVKVLLSFVEIARKSSNINEAVKSLDAVQQAARKLPPSYQVKVLIPLAEAYTKASNIDKAMNSLDEAWQATNKLNSSEQAFSLSSLAGAQIKLGMPVAALKNLSQAQQMAKEIPSNEKSLLLVSLVTQYAKLSRWREAREAAESIGDEVYAIQALTKILIIEKGFENNISYMDALEELFQEKGPS